MNIREKMDQAFRNIQSNPELWKAWNACIHQSQRDEMMAQALYDIAYKQGYAQCDEDISMGGI